MGSGNWVVDNLNSSLTTWDTRMAELWSLVSTSPDVFKGGAIWSVILNIHNALQAIAYGLLVLFFVMGVVKNCGNFADLKRPEVAIKVFIRFALAQAAVTWGLELLVAIISIVQGTVSTILTASGMSGVTSTTLPTEIILAIESEGFLESIPLQFSRSCNGGLDVCGRVNLQYARPCRLREDERQPCP